MKLPILNTNNSLSSCSSNSSSTNSSSWPWPSCNQNPKTISFRATIAFTNPIHDQEDNDELNPRESIEDVIQGIKSSQRLIFESKGDSNSILEEAMTKREEEEGEGEGEGEEGEEREGEGEEREGEEEGEGEGFMLLSLESNDPYSDFKRSMEEMVDANALHHDWRSLEKLLFQFLKVNAKTSHRYILAAFVDLLLKLALNTKTLINNNNFATEEGISAAPGEASTSSCNSMSLGESPSSPFLFYTSSSSYSSSDETSSTSVRILPLSSLLKMEENTKNILL